MSAAEKNKIDYCFYKEIAEQPKGEGITKCLRDVLFHLPGILGESGL